MTNMNSFMGFLIVGSFCLGLAEVNGSLSERNALPRGNPSFHASDFLSELKGTNRVFAVAFGSDRFSQWHVIDASTVTNLIGMLEGSSPHRAPTKESLQRRGVSRWDPPNPWIRMRVSGTNDHPVAWLQFYGGGTLFSWSEVVYAVRNGAKDYVRSELQMLEQRIK